jgi:hypothetical protein
MEAADQLKPLLGPMKLKIFGVSLAPGVSSSSAEGEQYWTQGSFTLFMSCNSL